MNAGDDSCTSGFISSEDIKEPATNITSVVADFYWNVFFKNIKIKCNGTIKSVLIGAKHYPDRKQFPSLRFWHYGNYSTPYLEIRLNNSEVLEDGVSRYNMSQPIDISSDDLLGIYQPNCSNAQTCIYYQQYSGPGNYRRRKNDNYSYLNLLTDRNHYPLISIVFGNFAIISYTSKFVIML